MVDPLLCCHRRVFSDGWNGLAVVLAEGTRPYLAGAVVGMRTRVVWVHADAISQHRARTGQERFVGSLHLHRDLDGGGRHVGRVEE